MARRLILVSGFSSTGKSSSLINLREPEKWIYINAEGKDLPFPSKFKQYKVEDPKKVLDLFDTIATKQQDIKGVIIDSITYLMDKFESMYINADDVVDTRAAWADYGDFFKDLVLNKISVFKGDVICLAHTLDFDDPATLSRKTYVPIKGSLKNQGVESYFSFVVSTKKKTLFELENYQNDMLHITDEDKAVDFKYVFQTKIDKKSLGERIRAPLGLFSTNETFIDNDCQVLLDKLDKYYAN